MKRMKIKSEYDLTRKMLKTLRTITESQSNKSTLTENINVNNAEQNLDNGIVVVNDVDVRLQSDDKNDLKLTSAQETTISGLIDNFRSQVSEIVDFNPGFTMSGKQIRLDGYLTDNDISFVLIAGEEEGAYVNAEMMKLPLVELSVQPAYFQRPKQMWNHGISAIRWLEVIQFCSLVLHVI